MPEIAEVEIVRRGLRPLSGQILERVEINAAKLGINDHVPEIVGSELTSLLRQGKWLGLELNEEKIISIHLRMTGHLALDQPDERDRARFKFTDNLLSFTDSRGFGTVDLMTPEQFRSKTGPDLFAGSDAELAELASDTRLSRSKRATKAVILDQQVLGGIGNYLADESLWRTSIHPRTSWDLLTTAERIELFAQAKIVATSALEHGGVSIRDYAAVDGSRGEMQNELQCYGRAGLPCFRCGATLEKTRVAARGTTYCPCCQVPRTS